jgi:hypothetical protein
VFDSTTFIKSFNNKMKCKGVRYKIRHFVRKLRCDVHGVVFDNKALIIQSITRRNVNLSDKIGRLVTSNLENYFVIYMVPCLIARHS